MDIPALYRLFLKHKQVCTDTRTIKANSIFFALKGEHFNGNDFAADALARGAAIAVIDKEADKRLLSDPRCMVVEDVLDTLQRLATYHRKECGFKILAITGSNGKTTTKELCRAVLSMKYKVHATAGNLNNHIGVPLTLLSMDPSAEIGIVEMGANHPGEIQFLCSIAQPDSGLITNIGKAHLEGFGGFEGVIRAKGELFAYLIQNKGQLIVNQGDINIVGLLPDTFDQYLYYNGEQGVNAGNIKANPLVEMDIKINQQVHQIKTNLVGKYNTENILAACCVGLHFGIPVGEVVEALKLFKPVGYRSQLITTGQNSVYMDAYNANPSSMLAALKEFLVIHGINKLVILGEMKEIGKLAIEEHRNVLAYLKDKGVKDVICVGRSFQIPSAQTGYPYFHNVESLSFFLKEHPVKGKFIFIKGSRSNRLEQLMEWL